MISFQDGQIADIMPENFKVMPEVMAISYALQRANQKIIKYAKKTSVYAETNNLTEDILDLLAIELRSQYYNKELDINIKRKIIANTLLWYYKAGTPASIKELVSTIFGTGEVQEWFEYGGAPFYFRVNVKNMEVNTQERKNFVAMLDLIKRTSTHLEKITFTFDGKVILDIKIEPRITIRGNFYPRYNLGNLYLDDTWGLDGVYSLNGYKGKNYINFYPVELQIVLHVYYATGLEMNMLCVSDVLKKILTGYKYTIKSECEVTEKLENRLQIVSCAYCGIELKIKVGCLSKLECNVLITSNYQIETEVEIAMEYKKVVRICTSASVNIETDLKLTTGKEVWCLDSSVPLDGSRMIPEKINNFDL